MIRSRATFLGLAVACLGFASPAFAVEVPRPSDVFGFEPGEDYKLADYDQMREY